MVFLGFQYYRGCTPFHHMGHVPFRYGHVTPIWPPIPEAPPPLHDSFVSLRFPLWVPFALTAILPALWVWRRLRDRLTRQADGMPHCPKCDYNLTGNVSGICPECGTPIPADLVRRPVT